VISKTVTSKCHLFPADRKYLVKAARAITSKIFPIRINMSDIFSYNRSSTVSKKSKQSRWKSDYLGFYPSIALLIDAGDIVPSYTKIMTRPAVSNLNIQKAAHLPGKNHRISKKSQKPLTSSQ